MGIESFEFRDVSMSVTKRSYLPFATKINVLIDIRAYYNNEFPLRFDTIRKKRLVPRVPPFCNLPFSPCFPGYCFSPPAVGLEMTKN